MPNDFSKLFPGAGDFISGLPVNFPIIGEMQSLYAPFGALHLVGLALLGGCVILLNLRLLGAGLVDEQPSLIERNLRPWLITGAAIVIGTGIIIGILNAEKLYYSPAFFAKMLAMLSALIFTFGVTGAVAKSEGQVSNNIRIAAGVAFVVWLVSMGVFSTAEGVNPGVFHMITAGYAILALFGARTRWIGIAGFALLSVGIFVMYFIVGFDNIDMVWQDVCRWALIASSILLIGLLGYEIFTGKAEAASPLARLIAVFSILAWVTVAAGGRWIGFS
jgi:hypothetical protein